MEDYIHMMSKPAYYLKADGFYQMRVQKWEPWFHPEYETSTALPWISFPSLASNFFVKESLVTMDKAVEKPLHVDIAMKNKSTPSCAKVKVVVDLLKDFPKRINIGMKWSGTGDSIANWIDIKYDYMPKYCKSCRLQGNNKKECEVLHPDLKPVKENKEEESAETSITAANMKQQEQLTKDALCTDLVVDKGKKAMKIAVPSKDAWNHGRRKNERAQKRTQEIINKKEEHQVVINVHKDNNVESNHSFAILDDQNEKAINLEEKKRPDKSQSGGVVTIDADGSSGSKLIKEIDVSTNEGIEKTDQIEEQVLNNNANQSDIDGREVKKLEESWKPAESEEGQESNGKMSSRSQEAVVEKEEPGGSVPKTPRSNSPQEIRNDELKEDLLKVQIDVCQKKSVNTQQSFERLTNLNRSNRYSIIVLMEPFEDSAEVENFRRKLGMETAFVNISVGGDFNVISSEEEKLGGLPVSFNEVADFNHCLSSCGLQDLGYVGSTYTWWNGRTEEACIFKRLDRMVCNDKLLDVLPTMSVSHLIKKGSDHSPLELECLTTAEVIIKPFKFLNFWVQHESFQEVIKQNWCIDFEGNPFTKFHHKLKKQIASLEEVIKVHEEQFETSPTVQNRERLHRKSGLAWFQDGDRNSKKFHAYVKGRRKKLGVHNIQDDNGNWLTNQGEISQEAIRFYQKQFEEDRILSKFGLLKHIPTLVTEEQNHKIEMLPTEKEVKKAVFALNGESACGPDGFTGLFFQSCWEIVKLDVVDMVKAFFVGKELPRFITHTNLILIPKKEQVQSFSELRPISLSNFTNKIISRVLHERLVKLLPG
ncbi:uncharacterized protein LOC132062424 [Lycium ferocissimum]|uniref:uncharacterized protein LOC132062424 n=1 Tax=Lycium ferocissimum TaxID=112874 RepID=UPI002816975F|nr:uncharacterized protein LOC132062424 [Lycium ferocissimum]